MRTLSRAQRWILLVGLLLCAPVFAVGLYNDDYVHRAILLGRAPGFSTNPLRLYEFTRGPGDAARMAAEGILPWWTSPSMHLRFFRPLSSALVALDHTVGQGSAHFGHAHGLLWFAALLALAAWLFAKLLPPRAAAVATLSYALAAHHLNSTVWLSSRNGLVAGVFALGSMALYLRARLAGRTLSVGALACLALGLLSGETALGALAMLASWETLASRDPWAVRARAFAPMALVGFLYLGAYSALGYGAGGGAGYVDPFHQTGAFLARMPQRLLVLVCESVFQIPSELTMIAPAATSVLAALGALALCVLLVSLRPGGPARRPEHTRAVWALLVGALLAVVPGTAAVLGGRVLPVAGVGLAALVGTALSELWERRARGLGARLAAYVVCGALGFAMLVMGPALRVLQPLNLRNVSRAQGRIAAEAEWGCGPGGDALILASADPSIAMYGGVLMALSGRTARSARVLSMVPAAHRLTRVGAQSFELEPLGGARFFQTTIEQIYRGPAEPLALGAPTAGRGMTATVTAGEPSRPTRVRFELGRPLSEPGVCVLEWRAGALRRAALPEVGSSREVPYEKGPMGL